MSSMKDKVAVIAGGSSGFGEATARRLRAAGARVLVAARDETKLAAVAKELGAEALRCDITSFAEVKALADAALERFGRLDIAVNSAGFEHNAPIANLEPENVEKMVAVQFTGALYFIQHMANAMAEGGSIITVSSLTGTLVAEGYAPYAGAKAGINHASKIAASEYGARGVRVNLVSPTTVETPMIAEMLAVPGVRESIEAETPLGTLPEVEDVVDAIEFLAGDQSRFVTGENLHVDGGGALRRLPRAEEIMARIRAAAAKD